MNIADIRELANMMLDTGLTYLEVDDEDLCIKMKREIEVQVMGDQRAASIGVIGGYDAPRHSPITGAPAAELRNDSAAGKLVKSPTVGVYYASPTPDSKSYVQMGDTVKTGDVLCIIEAMKLMNEITADCGGEIVEIFAGNGQVVEYGQPLFRIQ